MKKIWVLVIGLIALIVITNTDIVARISGQAAAYEQAAQSEEEQEIEAKEPGFIDKIVTSIKNFLFLQEEEELETVVVEDDTEEEKVEKTEAKKPAKEKKKIEETEEAKKEEPEEDEWQDDTTIEEMIGNSAVSGDYTGAPAHNVQLACDYNNGIIVYPGGLYSAFDYLGDGGEDMGFEAAAGLLSDGSTVDMYGSGICTVTTAIYQAGRDAGLSIVEVSDHVGAESSYAATGDQAMFNYPTNDLKMRNDFDYPVSLYMGYHDGIIYAEWYAVKDE